MNKLKQLLSVAIIGLAVATVSNANVRAEMNQMKGVASALTNANDVATFQKAAKELRDLAVQSAEKKPSSIDNDADFKGYQEGMKEFIAVIDEADKLAQEGNLDAAKTTAKKLFDIRNEYHKKYK
ncbi:MAG: cytochrome b562 [Pasteurella oralis]|uniref:cytochrome b562 n=1 Tax=Pasteurella oralis TaxID=1071947 RepID=UPI0027069896|nr:cytochrome b562 [Pasteurella oralis]